MMMEVHHTLVSHLPVNIYSPKVRSNFVLLKKEVEERDDIPIEKLFTDLTIISLVILTWIIKIFGFPVRDLHLSPLNLSKTSSLRRTCVELSALEPSRPKITPSSPCARNTHTKQL